MGAAVVDVSAEGASTIRWYTSRDLSLPASSSYDQLLSKVVKTTSQVLADVHTALQRGKHRGPDQIVAVLASPWYTLSTHRIDQRFDEMHEITESYTATLKRKAASEFQRRASEVFQKYFHSQDEARLIESSYLEWILNGYPTNRPHGKYARSFGGSLFFSAAPQRVCEGIDRAVDEHFSVERLTYISQPSVLARNTRSRFSTTHTTLLVSINGEQTEVTILTDGVLRDVVLYEEGENDIVRGAAKETEAGPEVVRSFLSLREASLVDDQQQPALAEAVSSALARWKQGFHDTLDDLRQSRYDRGNRVIIFSRGDLGTKLQEAIQKLYNNGAAEVVVPSQETFQGEVSFREDLVFDPFLAAVAAVSRHRVFSED